MCMIAYRPVTLKGGASNIPNGVIDTAMNRHSDGFGVAWRENGVLRSVKFGPSRGARKEFRKTLKRIDATGDEYVAHFRFATHGPKAQSHSHPYEYMDPDEKVGKVLVFHNGVISMPTRPSESDTEVFVRDVLATLPSRWWDVPSLRWLVGESIGWSRIVLMTATETVNLQEKDGEWDGGIWYSSSHRPTKYANWAKGAERDGVWVHNGAVSTYHPYEKPYAGNVATGTGTGVKSAAASAMVLLPSVTPASAQRHEACPNPALNTLGESARTTRVGRQLRHGGHNVQAMVDLDFGKDGDYEDAVICETCYTTGHVYMIDGTPFIDMGHLDLDTGRERDTHEEEALLDDEYERDLLPA